MACKTRCCNFYRVPEPGDNATALANCGRPSSFIIRDVHGMEWFACDDREHHKAREADERIAKVTPIYEWFENNGLPVPP